jgi:hypothetical protein
MTVSQIATSNRNPNKVTHILKTVESVRIGASVTSKEGHSTVSKGLARFKVMGEV